VCGIVHRFCGMKNYEKIFIPKTEQTRCRSFLLALGMCRLRTLGLRMCRISVPADEANSKD